MKKKESTACLSLLLGPDRGDEMTDLLVDLGATAVAEQDQSTMDRAPAGKLELVAGFVDCPNRDAALATIEGLEDGSIEVRAVDVEDDGWSTSWRAHFQPVVLDRLQVITPWMQAPRPDLLKVVIDPGQAFGTGGHATTRLILRLLESRASKGELPRAVLDVGTGSGVLAISAALLGVDNVLAVDVEPESIDATRENAVVNGVGSAIDARLGSIDVVGQEFSLVLANIQLAVFENIAEQIAKCVSPGGQVLVSGVLTDQKEACLSLFSDFRVVDLLAEQEWIALALERPQ